MLRVYFLSSEPWDTGDWGTGDWSTTFLDEKVSVPIIDLVPSLQSPVANYWVTGDGGTGDL